MSEDFFKQPILNSPYEYPAKHWQLDETGQPTQNIVPARRKASYVSPIPKPKHLKSSQPQLLQTDPGGISTAKQEYDVTATINHVRGLVDEWRTIKDPAKWRVTPETAQLLQHWRHYEFNGVRPFFCQVEAAETAIWLTEVAPETTEGKKLLDHLKKASDEANPGLNRLALKLATGAGKTTVMAMLIAWQTINAVRHPRSDRFTRGFLIVCPGLTIKDRLRVLQPNDPENYYFNRELIPQGFEDDMKRARIVLTNYHAFKLRDTLELAKGTRALLEGRGEPIKTLETEGQMLHMLMPELLALRNVVVINDEAHHCYRRGLGKKEEEEFEGLKGEDKREAKEEAKKNGETARLWISGLEALSRKLNISRVFDLSATPFFLRGAGYNENTLFPWTMSDFSLMDAIECGVVKLPRVPVSQNIPGGEMPIYRDLWTNIRSKMPKKGRTAGHQLDPLSLPVPLQTALDALYGHYKQTFELWQDAVRVPPCFIVVCNNTSTSKLVYDFISGFHQELEGGGSQLVPGRFELFRNFDEHDRPYARPRTILVDSSQLDSGESLDDNFREMAKDEIERFRAEITERTGDLHAADKLTDSDLLREVMNTVGKVGRLGETVRCVVSVSMLTEGWDANTVTHILGVRAFGTQLLCEQVIGRALRRQSYELNEDKKFDVEYADVLGIPFDFNAKPVIAKPQPPKETILVQAVRGREACEIQFPRVQGYRVELPEERLSAKFGDDSILILSPAIVGPTITENQGIIGESATLTVEHLGDVRRSTLQFELTKHLLFEKWRDPDGQPKTHLFGQLKRIAGEWLDTCLECQGGTYPAQLMYKQFADIACERISAGINRAFIESRPVKAVVDPYTPTGSTRFVNFPTSKTNRWQTDPRKCHVNWVILDSDWEAELCRIAESHASVRSYVKNQGLGFEIPYRFGGESKRYLPDYILLVDDGHGEDDQLHLIVEIKGYRREDAKEKKSAAETYWVPGVNQLGEYGRWAFLELTEIWTMEEEFNKKIQEGAAWPTA